MDLFAHTKEVSMNVFFLEHISNNREKIERATGAKHLWRSYNLESIFSGNLKEIREEKKYRVSIIHNSEVGHHYWEKEKILV